MGRILIIEDDAQIRKMLRRVLEDAGYEVEEAPDGLEGIELYRKKPADLVITDIVMPEKEGLETIIELRREFQDVKIIAISGGGRIRPEPYLQVAEGFGVEHVFTKPFDIRDLLAAVVKLVE